MALQAIPRPFQQSAMAVITPPPTTNNVAPTVDTAIKVPLALSIIWNTPTANGGRMFDLFSDVEKQELIRLGNFLEKVEAVQNSMEWKFNEAMKEIRTRMLFFDLEPGHNIQYFVVVLHLVKAMIPENFLKYPTPSSFLCKYDKFSGSNKYNDVELNTLRDVANWMDVLLHIINAKKNKGLILSIVTKCVEGWNASYITGSGQTEATADRVHIYETEGQVKPLKRSKNILMKPPSPYVANTTTKKGLRNTKKGNKKTLKKQQSHTTGDMVAQPMPPPFLQKLTTPPSGISLANYGTVVGMEIENDPNHHNNYNNNNGYNNNNNGYNNNNNGYNNNNFNYGNIGDSDRDYSHIERISAFNNNQPVGEISPEETMANPLDIGIGNCQPTASPSLLPCIPKPATMNAQDRDSSISMETMYKAPVLHCSEYRRNNNNNNGTSDIPSSMFDKIVRGRDSTNGTPLVGVQRQVSWTPDDLNFGVDDVAKNTYADADMAAFSSGVTDKPSGITRGMSNFSVTSDIFEDM